MMLDNSQIESFKQKGFLVIKNFFDSDFMNQILNEVNRLDVLEPIENGPMKYYEESQMNKNEMLLIRIEKFIETSPLLKSVVYNEAMIEVISTLLSDKPTLLKEKINYKPYGSQPDYLHQDSQAGWDKYGTEFISALIAVEDSNQANACVEFDVSGKYKDKLIGPLWEPLNPDRLEELDLQSIETISGDIILFNSYVPHGSEANKSTNRRCNIYITYNKKADGDHREQYFSEKRESFPPNNERDPSKDYSFKV
jgi:ectoine hydroxylase-related dioxygenase (phytanoyl-CoA dioxygenase family)|tara:strand:+ start:627 stop:1385 length:759 start_codon:yes stop_codon:yes gene_type:complete